VSPEPERGPPVTPLRSPRYLWYALAALTAVNLLSYVNRNVIFALFVSVERDLGFSDLDAGWIASAYVLVFSLAALPFGVFSDLRSRRAVMAGGIALWSAFSCLAGLSQGFASLFLTRAMVGAGGAAAAAAAASLVADYFPGNRRALAMGIYMSGISLGGVMGILLGGALQTLYGWRVAMMAVGFPGFVLALLAWRLDDPGRPALSLTVREVLHELELGARGLIRVIAPILAGTGIGAAMAWYLNRRYGPDSKLDTAAFAAACAIGLAVNIVQWVRQARRTAPSGALAEPDVVQTALDEIARAFHVVLRTPTLVYIFIGGALISFGMNGLVGWAPTLLSRTLGLTALQISGVLGTYGLIAGIAGTLVGGWLADVMRRRWASARVVVAGIGFILGGPLAIWLLTIRDLDLFIPVFSAAFFFLTWYSGPLTAAIFDVAPARLSATVVGAYLLFIHLAGDAVAFPLIGMLSDRFGLDRAAYLLPAMALAGGLVVLAASRTIARDITQVTKVTGEWKVVGGGGGAGGQ
jgi:MFS family permease